MVHRTKKREFAMRRFIEKFDYLAIAFAHQALGFAVRY